MKKSVKFSPEVRERAVRMVAESRADHPSQTLLTWVRQHERDSDQREGPTTADQKRVKELEREVKELRKASEILKLASAFFAQAELDRRFKS
jgi:transposase-like protein